MGDRIGEGAVPQSAASLKPEVFCLTPQHHGGVSVPIDPLARRTPPEVLISLPLRLNIGTDRSAEPDIASISPQRMTRKACDHHERIIASPTLSIALAVVNGR